MNFYKLVGAKQTLWTEWECGSHYYRLSFSLHQNTWHSNHLDYSSYFGSFIVHHNMVSFGVHLMRIIYEYKLYMAEYQLKKRWSKWKQKIEKNHHNQDSFGELKSWESKDFLTSVTQCLVYSKYSINIGLIEEKKLVREMKTIAISVVWVDMARWVRCWDLRDWWTHRAHFWHSGSGHLQGTSRSWAGWAQDVRSGKDDLINSHHR